MRWDDLQIFLAVGRAGTLTGAATRLGVTHTTVGRRIRALEEQLGVRLFDRTPAGLRATPDGEEVLEVATRMEQAVGDTERRVMGRDDDPAGELRVSLFDFLLWACAPALKVFVDRHPEIRLTLHTSLEAVSLSKREADVAMRLTDTPPETMVGRRVGTLGFAPYAHVDLVDAVGPDAPLSAYPWVGLDPRVDNSWFDHWIAEHAPGARISVWIGENALLRRLAITSGMGAHLLPTYEGDAAPELRRIGPVHITRGLWLLTHPELRHVRRVRLFVEHMVEALQVPSVIVRS